VIVSTPSLVLVAYSTLTRSEFLLDADDATKEFWKK